MNPRCRYYETRFFVRPIKINQRLFAVYLPAVKLTEHTKLPLHSPFDRGKEIGIQGLQLAGIKAHRRKAERQLLVSVISDWARPNNSENIVGTHAHTTKRPLAIRTNTQSQTTPFSVLRQAMAEEVSYLTFNSPQPWQLQKMESLLIILSIKGFLSVRSQRMDHHRYRLPHGHAECQPFHPCKEKLRDALFTPARTMVVELDSRYKPFCIQPLSGQICMTMVPLMIYLAAFIVLVFSSLIHAPSPDDILRMIVFLATSSRIVGRPTFITSHSWIQAPFDRGKNLVSCFPLDSWVLPENYCCPVHKHGMVVALFGATHLSVNSTVCCLITVVRPEVTFHNPSRTTINGRNQAPNRKFPLFLLMVKNSRLLIRRRRGKNVTCAREGKCLLLYRNITQSHDHASFLGVDNTLAALTTTKLAPNASVCQYKRSQLFSLQRLCWVNKNGLELLESRHIPWFAWKPIVHIWAIWEGANNLVPLQNQLKQTITKQSSPGNTNALLHEDGNLLQSQTISQVLQIWLRESW